MSEPSPTFSSATARAASKSGKRYSPSFKQDALRLITQEGYSFSAAAHATGVSEKSLREWHKKSSPPPPESGGDDASVDELKKEVRRLCEQLRQTEMEREILSSSSGGATAYFASQKP